MTDEDGEAQIVFSVWEDFIGYTVTVICGYTDQCENHFVDSLKIYINEI